MSQLIENIARNLKTNITGSGPSETEQQQTDRGHKLISQWAKGGLALGAGAGSIVALMNYLKSLRKEDEVMDEERLDDSTLYVKAHEKKADVNRWLAPGLAVTGGILAGGTAYGLTQAIYNYIQKKRRQALLDEVQGEALEAAELELGKSAAEGRTKMSFSDLVTAFPVAVPLLAALASGGVAYAALRKTFPVVKSPASKYPRRIRQVAAGGKVEKLDEKHMPKSASINDVAGMNDCEDAAGEFLLMFTDQLSIEKSASISLTSDIINRAAKEGVTGMISTLQAGGVESLVESVKGASDRPATMPNKALAAALICKSARLAPVVKSIAAAEYQDIAPGMYAAALEQGEDHLDKMAGVGALFQMSFIRPEITKESAALNELPQSELLEVLEDSPGVHDMLNVEDLENALTSDVAGVMRDDSEISEEESEEASDEEITDGNDPVDAMLDLAEKSDLTTELPDDKGEGGDSDTVL